MKMCIIKQTIYVTRSRGMSRMSAILVLRYFLALYFWMMSRTFFSFSFFDVKNLLIPPCTAPKQCNLANVASQWILSPLYTDLSSVSYDLDLLHASQTFPTTRGTDVRLHVCTDPRQRLQAPPDRHISRWRAGLVRSNTSGTYAVLYPLILKKEMPD